MIPFKHPLRHPLQAMVSLGQIYGLILYYGTATFDHYVFGVSYSRPEAYYFWGYYFLCNFFWIIVPGSECLPGRRHEDETDIVQFAFTTASTRRARHLGSRNLLRRERSSTRH